MNWSEKYKYCHNNTLITQKQKPLWIGKTLIFIAYCDFNLLHLGPRVKFNQPLETDSRKLNSKLQNIWFLHWLPAFSSSVPLQGYPDPQQTPAVLSVTTLVNLLKIWEKKTLSRFTKSTFFWHLWGETIWYSQCSSCSILYTSQHSNMD